MHHHPPRPSKRGFSPLLSPVWLRFALALAVSAVLWLAFGWAVR